MDTPNYPRGIDVTNGDEIRLSDYLVIVTSKWKFIAAIALSIFFLGILYAFLVPPVYRADAMIQVEDNAGATKEPLGELASIFDAKQTANAEIELMRSRLVVGKAVESLHLDIKANPRHFPLIGAMVARARDAHKPTSPLLGLDQFAWGGEKIKVSLFDVPQKWYDEHYMLVAKGPGEFDLFDPDGNHVLSGYTGRVIGARDAAGPVSIQVDELLGRPGTEFVLSRSPTESTISDLQKALTIAEKTKQSAVIGVALEGRNSQRTVDIVNTIANAYVQQNINWKSAQAARTLAFLNEQLPQLMKQLDEAEASYNAFRIQNGTVDLSEESRLLLQRIVDGKSKVAELKVQRAELVQRFDRSHPAVAGLDAQIASLEGLEAQLSKRIEVLPETEQTALRLLRDVRVDTQLYTSLLDSAQQLRVIKASELGNVRVVDYAVATGVPVRPKRALVIILSLAVGLVVGVVAALGRRMLFGGVERNEDIERAVGVPVYATVPHSPEQARLQQRVDSGRSGRHILASVASDDVAIEGIRSLRTALQFGLVEGANNILAIAGSRPAVGKSFTAVNLSAVIAGGGKRVLLIDADMRRGNVHSYFGVPGQPGLSDVIAGLDIEGNILRSVIPGMDVLRRGSLPPNPAELLMTERFQSLLRYLSSRYDVVVIDTPPVLAVTDAAVIGEHAGATLLVLRHGQHHMAEIVESVTRLRQGGARVKGLLVTDVPKRRLGYGSYSPAYYSYKRAGE